MGTIGFTLHDEWRYLDYRKEAPFCDPAAAVPDMHPLLPQVVNPHDREWDVLDKFGDDCFGASDLAERLPIHRAFREACASASAPHPDLKTVGLFQTGDYVRCEGTDVVHLPSKLSCARADGKPLGSARR